jgi:hypothetical protein
VALVQPARIETASKAGSQLSEIEKVMIETPVILFACLSFCFSPDDFIGEPLTG